MRARLRPLDAKTYVAHDIHRRERVWAESNCYVDLWIELLHGLGLDPVPCLAFTLDLDFEGDQLTFFKFPHADLRRMYGLEVVEINVWRSLAFHVSEQVTMGRAPIVEIDSFYLPDTAGVSYQLEHTKSSIAIQDVDLDARRLGYFHGQSYHELSGDDFDAALRRGPPHDDPSRLAPYFEAVKLDRLERRDTTSRALLLLREHLLLRPRENPLAKLAARFPADLAFLQAEPLSAYHVWAFATLRQAGASFELCAVFLHWLLAEGERGLEETAAACDVIAQGARTLMLKVARAVNGKRALDASEPLDAMTTSWDTVMRSLDARYRLDMAVLAPRRAPLELGAWELAECPPGAATTPAAIDERAGEWLPAIVPGTVAGALARAGRFSLTPPRDLDASDWWFRARFASDGGAATLRLDGLASLAEVFLNGERVLSSSTMLRPHEIDATLRADNTLHLRFLSLTDALRAKRPRPRWKTRLVSQQQLRWFRTTLLGRIPGWTPPVTPVGPFRAVTVSPGTSPTAHSDVRTRVEGRDGVVSIAFGPRADQGIDAAWLRVGDEQVLLALDDDGRGHRVFSGTARVPEVRLWWPHTHGEQALYPVRVEARAHGETITLDAGQTGFRTLEALTEGGDFGLRVNGVDVFVRGACWMPTDPLGLSAEADGRTLAQLRDAGMNMVRCSGTMPYEPDGFFRACDELGLLVWQDFAFANMDYPATDAAFSAEVALEAAALASRTQLSPSLAVFCGGSEVEQQAAMVGAPRELWSNDLFDRVLPDAVRARGPQALYVRNSPTGGALPFTVDHGVSHYYGVGAYLRPLEDARRADVRFTSECLGFSNVPSARTCDLVLGEGNAAPQDPRWKARVPRDGGVGWDFEDVRDHYLCLLYGVDPARLRYADPERYLALSREVTGEVMARTMTEWRRSASRCRGALVWFARDLVPGAGWGVIDATGAPKAAWFHLRRALAKVAVALSDEGLNGLRAHAWNDGAAALPCALRVALYKDGEIEVAGATTALTIPPRGEVVTSLDELLASFTDATYAYRFGPPAHDVVVATLSDPARGAVLSEAFFHPHGPPKERARDLGLAARALREGTGFALELTSRRLAWGVAIELDGLLPADDNVTLAPGATRRISLAGDASVVRGTVSALNGAAPVRVVEAG